ncbi:hypothetical protein E2C01_077674 [Portunus trituberculatus]|uniref:Uncharacterized protein n=1 Tax=Portunus trituberculatus TaxID=210409 RepID=A0A5B7IS39_PORTR|nr:hypothetical protein [Portunus trituberculatus]
MVSRDVYSALLIDRPVEISLFIISTTLVIFPHSRFPLAFALSGGAARYVPVPPLATRLSRRGVVYLIIDISQEEHSAAPPRRDTSRHLTPKADRNTERGSGPLSEVLRGAKVPVGGGTCAVLRVNGALPNVCSLCPA